MKKFKLLDRELLISDNVQNYNALRHTLDTCESELVKLFEKMCNENITNADELFQNVPAIFSSCAELFSEECIKFFVNENIFSVDAESFLSKSFKYHDGFFNELDSLENEYANLFEDEAERKLNIEYARAGRSKWQGGGFGLSGAIKGAATAGVLNAGTGLFRAIGDNISDGLAKSKFEGRKREFFKNSNYLKRFRIALRSLFWDMHIVLINFLSDEGCPKYKVDFDDDKANALLSNLTKGLIPQAKRVDIIYEILENYPYLDEVYGYALTSYPDNAKEIFAVADFFNVYMGVYYVDYLVVLRERFFDDIKASSTTRTNVIYFENAGLKASRQKFVDTCIELGLDKKEEEAYTLTLEDINKFVDDIDRRELIDFYLNTLHLNEKSHYTEYRTAIVSVKNHADKISASKSVCDTVCSDLEKRLHNAEFIDFHKYIVAMLEDLSAVSGDEIKNIESTKKKIQEYYDKNGFSCTEKLQNVLTHLEGERVRFQLMKLTALYNSLPKSTEEDAIASKKKLEKATELLELPKDNEVLKDISSLIMKFDLDALTSDGIKYSTREEKANAQAASDSFRQLLPQINFTSPASVQSAIQEVEQYCSPTKKGIISFIHAKELCAITLEKMEGYLIPSKFLDYVNTTEKYAMAIDNKWLEDLILEDNERIMQRCRYLESEDYKKKYKLAYDYCEQKNSTPLKEITSGVLGIIVFSLLAWWLIGLFTKEYNLIISGVLTILAVIGMIGSRQEIATKGKVAYHELVKNPNQILEKYE